MKSHNRKHKPSTKRRRNFLLFISAAAITFTVSTSINYLPSALHKASARNDVKTLNILLNSPVKYWIDHEKRPFKDNRLQTPLGWAARHDAVEAGNLLIAHGANPLGGDFHALQLAAQEGHLRFVELLLSNGVSVRDTSRKAGSSPLHMLIGSSSHRCSDKPQVRLEIARLLLDHGADPNGRDPLNEEQQERFGRGNGQTPFYAAAYHECGEILELLAQRGAEVNPLVYGKTLQEHLVTDRGGFSNNKILSRITQVIDKYSIKKTIRGQSYGS